MKPRRGRMMVASLLSILGLLMGTNPCDAHPVSHVDAWARVGDELELRIIVFLDNVLATPDVERATSESLIPTAVAEQALRSFEESLPQLLTVENERGQLLLPQIVKRPRWTPSQRGVDPTADGNLRLAWRLRFPWNPAQRSFVLRHRFLRHLSAEQNPETDRQQPCEVRLRVLCEQTGRRVQTTVADHQPHRIVLPPTHPESAADVPPALSRAGFVLLPGRLIHEFSLPLQQFTRISAVDGARLQSSPVENGASDEELRAQVVDWVRQHGTLQLDGIVSVAESIDVELLTQDDELLSDSESETAVASRLGMRMTHRTAQPPARITADWTAAVASFGQLQLDTLHGTNAATEIVELAANDTSSARIVTYSWDVPSAVPNEAAPADQHGADAYPPDRMWQRASGSGALSRRGLVIPAVAWVGVLVLCVVVARQAGRWRAILLLAAGTAIVVIASGRMIHENLRPDSTSTAGMLAEMLDRVYDSVLISDERAAVEQLSRVLNADLVETVFQDTAATINDADDGAPYIRIRDVQMLSCTTSGFHAPDWAAFQCEWQIDGDVLHWGHRHRRQMRLTGTIRLASDADSCLISEISLTGMETRVTAAGE